MANILTYERTIYTEYLPMTSLQNMHVCATNVEIIAPPTTPHFRALLI